MSEFGIARAGPGSAGRGARCPVRARPTPPGTAIKPVRLMMSASVRLVGLEGCAIGRPGP